jgi:YidC/Oxa1 family membrane protein insertase
MEKRLFSAILLSLFIVIGWSILTSKLYHVEKQEVMLRTLEQDPVSVAVTETVVEKEPEEYFLLGDKEYVFVLPYAAIKDVVFKDYLDYRFTLGEGLLWEQTGVLFNKRKIGKDSSFVYEDTEKIITKNYLFHNSNNTIELIVKIKNLKPSKLDINANLVLAKINLKEGNGFAARFREAFIGGKDKNVRVNLRKTYLPTEDTAFIAYRDRYFCAIVEPDQPGYKGFVTKSSDHTTKIGLSYKATIDPEREKIINFLIYLGPQDLQLISSIAPRWQGIIYYGVFDGISKFLLRALTFFHKITHNWGIAIVILSLSIYFVLYPLTLKQLRSMKKMQELQPRVEQLRKTLKNNPQKLNKEILELYRQEKVNPFGGCLPLILQMPIFFALYQALMRSLYLKGAHFLWITDLSEPDRLFTLPASMPFIGNEINLLPLLMMGMMFFQQKFSQAVSVGEAAEQQKMMGIIFPLLFGVIFYHMPSGLVLYWSLNSCLMVINQVRIKGKH